MRKLLLALILAGCGTDLRQPGDGWDERAKPIIREFTDDIKVYEIPLGKLGRILNIRQNSAKLAEYASENPEEHLLGVCLISTGSPGRLWRGEILILEDLDDETFRRVMYHELTHCVYELDHWGEEGDIQYPTVWIDVFSWEDAKGRHFRELKRRLE